MIPVACAKGIKVHCPESGMLAFCSSPYPGHVQGGAIDIFGSREFGSSVRSPVSGEVVIIDKSKVGISRYFKSEPYDYITVIRSNDFCVRILHVEPEIELGESITVGDDLGRYIRTPLLPFWSLPHAHLDVKDPSDPVSPQNVFLLERIGDGDFQGEPEFDFTTIKAEVEMANENYVMVEANIDIFGKIGKYFGVAVRIGDELGLLDAQTPWNCYGGVALSANTKVKIGDEVRMGNVLLGNVERIYKNIATYSFGGEVGDGIDRFSKGLLYRDVNRFNAPRKRIRVNGEEFLGFSIGLSLFENRTLRLIPKRPIEDKFEAGEILNIELDPN
jgi:hypothetical protein